MTETLAAPATLDLVQTIRTFAEITHSTLAPHCAPGGDGHLCRIHWAGYGVQDVMVTSGPLARFERISNHTWLQGTALEKDLSEKMRTLLRALLPMFGPRKLETLSIEIYMPAKKGGPRVLIEVNDFGLTERPISPRGAAGKLLQEIRG